MWIFITQYPASGKLRENIYWLVKKSLQRETVCKDRNRDDIQKGPYIVFFIRLWISSDHVPLSKLNALGTVHLTSFLSIDTYPRSPHPVCLSTLLYYPSFTGPFLHTVLSFLNQTIDKLSPIQVSLCEMVLSTCLSIFPVHLSVSVCLSGCFSNCLEVKEEVSGKVSVGLAADTLIGWVLGGLNCDGHYVGGWWEVWVASPWHLPLWHDVVDGCDGEKGEREWVMCRCL